jgi:hypothetical protein
MSAERQDAIEIITLSDADGMPAKRLRAHADDEHAAGVIDPETRAQWERAAENAHREWVESLRQRACDKAAADAACTGSALLLWTDQNGKLQARRISREDSQFREYVPDFLRRRSAR